MDFKSGDKVIWLKRILGADDVHAVPAVVLDLTEKRIKIVADEEGQIVIRYVLAGRLQKRKRSRITAKSTRLDYQKA